MIWWHGGDSTRIPQLYFPSCGRDVIYHTIRIYPTGTCTMSVARKQRRRKSAGVGSRSRELAASMRSSSSIMRCRSASACCAGNEGAGAGSCERQVGPTLREHSLARARTLFLMPGDKYRGPLRRREHCPPHRPHQLTWLYDMCVPTTSYCCSADSASPIPIVVVSSWK